MESRGRLESYFSRFLAPADIFINGGRPWDIQIHEPRLYRRLLLRGSLGFGEAYMDGWWDVDDMDELFFRLLNLDMDIKLQEASRLFAVISKVRQRMFNLQTMKRAFQVADTHYNLGNDLFDAMLDPTMSYSCGYWQSAQTLEEAQHAKLDLICRKLNLRPGMRLLDVGCGWGGLAEHAARHYGASVVGITISEEQCEMARERVKGLPVDIRLEDYRELAGQFERIVSVGMFEHVGLKNYSAYFKRMNDLLSDGGLFLLHTIGNAREATHTDPWIEKYIFPNGYNPALHQVVPALEPWFIVEDLHNFGPDYDKTLMAWWENFDAHWPELSSSYDDRFYRMWRYYLMSCAGYFRSRQGQLWQMVLSKHHHQARYTSIR